MLKVVLDTNVLLVSISNRSKHHWIFQKLINQQYEICVTTEILNEYAEIIDSHMGHEVSTNTMGVLENLSNVNFVVNYYRFGLLKDEDDNKFIDCAIASNADFVVSHDKDFDVLKNISFPKVRVIDSGKFKKLI